LKLGEKHGEGKKERLARRAANKMRDDDEDGEFENEYEDEEDDYDYEEEIPDTPLRKRGQRIPSWKKHNDKKKLRQAESKMSAE
jgi:hypothetical protein